VNRIQADIDRVRSPDCSIEEVLATLKTGAPIVVANALERIRRDEVVPHQAAIEAIEAAVKDPRYAIRIMGTTSLAHLAVATLFRLGDEARERGRALLETWAEPDRSDLLWFLRSEGIEIGNSQ
jgi:hypothetical protein